MISSKALGPIANKSVKIIPVARNGLRFEQLCLILDRANHVQSVKARAKMNAIDL